VPWPLPFAPPAGPPHPTAWRAPAKPVNDNKADPNADPQAPPKEAPKDSAEASAKVAEEPGPKPSNDNAVAPEAPIKVDEKALRESVELTITEHAWGQGRNLSGIRTDLIENGDDLNAIMSATERMYADEITKQRGGTEVLTNAQLKAQADELADIPGFSQDLDPVRNILGEPVTPPPTYGPGWLSPIVAGVHTGKEQPTTPEWKASPREDVKDEMARLALIGDKGFTHPPTTKDGVDLLDYRSPVTGKTAYDRWLELTGTVKMGGMNVHEMLAAEIASSAYQAMMTDGSEEDDEDGSRIGHIKTILGGFRMMAMEELKREMPDLAQELMKGQISRARALVQQPKQN